MPKQLKTSARKPAAPVKGAKVKLAAITPLTAAQVAKAFASAVKRRESADVSFMLTTVAAAKLIGTPLTASQYDAQIGPYVREAFSAKAMSSVAETSRASYRSRFKTLALAVCSGLPAFQPKAGEGLASFLGRVAEPLASAKLKDGRRIWDTAKQGRTASAPGSKPGAKSGGAAGGPTTGGSAGSVNDSEGGLDVKPAMAAALILARGNTSRAQRLVTVMQTYAEEFDRWTASILTDADKAELAKLAPPKGDAVTRSSTPPATKVLPAMGAALVTAQAKANAKAA